MSKRTKQRKAKHIERLECEERLRRSAITIDDYMLRFFTFHTIRELQKRLHTPNGDLMTFPAKRVI